MFYQPARSRCTPALQADKHGLQVVSCAIFHLNQLVMTTSLKYANVRRQSLSLDFGASAALRAVCSILIQRHCSRLASAPNLRDAKFRSSKTATFKIISHKDAQDFVPFCDNCFLWSMVGRDSLSRHVSAVRTAAQARHWRISLRLAVRSYPFVHRRRIRLRRKIPRH